MCVCGTWVGLCTIHAPSELLEWSFSSFLSGQNTLCESQKSVNLFFDLSELRVDYYLAHNIRTLHVK